MALGRPKVPLISRERVLEVALRIADEEGLKALSTRRLAQELGVQGPSLYNHFKNMDEIILSAAELALAQVPPRMIKGHPVDLMVMGARQLRDSLRAHPNLVPAMVRQRSTGLGSKMLDAVTERLVADGVPVEAILPLFETLERFAIGTVMREITNQADRQLASEEAEEYPYFALATEHSARINDELFDEIARCIIEAVVQWAPAQNKRAATRSRRR